MDHTQTDQLDRQIIAILQKDGRTPFREIARSLEVSEGTVRRRYERMVAGGLLSVLATGDPMKFGIGTDALTLIKTQPGRAEEVAEQLSRLEQVRYVGVGIGSADVVIESLHPSTQALYEFLNRTLPPVAGITATETIQIARILKSNWDWQVWLAQSEPTEVKR